MESVWGGLKEQKEISNSKTHFDRHFKASSCYRAETFSGARSFVLMYPAVTGQGPLSVGKCITFFSVRALHPVGVLYPFQMCQSAYVSESHWQFREIILAELQEALNTSENFHRHF